MNANWKSFCGIYMVELVLFSYKPLLLELFNFDIALH